MSIEMPLRDAEVLIFGNPRLGTPVMQEDIRAGLLLPLRVLVHDGAEGTMIVYEEPDEMFDELDVDDDLEVLMRMEDALENLAARAAAAD